MACERAELGANGGHSVLLGPPSPGCRSGHCSRGGCSGVETSESRSQLVGRTNHRPSRLSSDSAASMIEKSVSDVVPTLRRAADESGACGTIRASRSPRTAPVYHGATVLCCLTVNIAILRPSCLNKQLPKPSYSFGGLLALPVGACTSQTALLGSSAMTSVGHTEGWLWPQRGF